MYHFVDTTEAQGANPLPSEALQINGEYLENLVAGYRTLYVSGRELLAQELSTTEFAQRHGSLYRSRRYPARVITVGFQLIAGSNEAFRSAFNALAGALNVEEAQLIFADEPDKYFVGTPSEVGDIEPGLNAVTGEFEITCTDPFKYSVEAYEVVPAIDNGRTIVVDYHGTAPSYPVLEVDFPTEEETSEDGESDVELTGNGDCGYVAFIDANEDIIQLGDPEEADGETVPKSQTLVSQSFKTAKAWGSAVQRKWSMNSGITTSASVTHTGTMKVAKSVSTDPNYYLTPDSYGTGDKWHGPSITRTIPKDAAGETGAVNCQMSCSAKFHIGNSTESEKQIGSLQAHLVSGSGSSRKIVAGISLVKNKSGKKGFIRFYLNGKIKQEVGIDLSYHNQYFGTNRAASKGVKAIQTVKTITIRKTGSKVEFNVGGVQKTFTDSALETVAVTQMTIVLLKYGTKTPLTCNGLYYAKFVKNNCSTWKEIPNKFSAGDIVVADCSSGSILLNDVEEPGLGAPGNDWEKFYLRPGLNQINTACSDWVADEPTFKLRYREAYL